MTSFSEEKPKLLTMATFAVMNLPSKSLDRSGLGNSEKGGDTFLPILLVFLALAFVRGEFQHL